MDVDSVESTGNVLYNMHQGGLEDNLQENITRFHTSTRLWLCYTATMRCSPQAMKVNN